MTRAECILAAITKELDRRQREIENEQALLEIHFRAKFDKRSKRFQSIQMSVYTEREIEEKAA